VLQIEGISCIERKEKEQDLHIIPIEGDLLHPISPTQVKFCDEPTTPCASLRSKVRSETLEIIVREGRKDNNKGSQSNGSNTITQI